MKTDSYDYKNILLGGILVPKAESTCPCCALPLSGCDCGFAFSVPKPKKSILTTGIKKLVVFLKEIDIKSYVKKSYHVLCLRENG